MKIRRVEKRDGREAPFDKKKIASAVARAQAAVGEDDPQFANEVADIVEMALARRYLAERPGAPPSEEMPGIEEIQDLVEQALIELGHAPVAKAYILYRDRRARIRSALEVRRANVLGDAATSDASSPSSKSDDAHDRATRGPRVQVSGGLESWRKGRIVAALMDEADLPRATAEDVAARVETHVFDSGLKRISTALIRELVDNELVDMGLSQALRRQRPVGLPRHDLRRILAESSASSDAELGSSPQETLAPRGASARIAGDILRRYALEDVLTEASAEMHLSGEFHVEALEHPHLRLVQGVPCDLLWRGEPQARSVFEMLDELAALVHGSSYGIVLEDCAPLVQALTRSTRATLTNGSSGALASFLLSLAALSRASGRRIDLCVPPSSAAKPATRDGSLVPNATIQPPPTWLVRLLEELVQLEDNGSAHGLPRVFLDAGEIVRLAVPGSSLARAADVSLARGRLVPTWNSRSERFAGPGLRRLQRERGAIHCGGAVALNLPRAARRAGPWREDALLENLAHLMESALDALATLREFQRSERSGTRSARGRTSYAISPVGLREALRWLGDGEIKPEQGARIVAFLAEAATRFGETRGLSVTLTPFFGERAAVRFAELDPEVFHVDQPLLFETASDPSHRARGAPYSTGFELTPDSPGLASGGLALGAGESALAAAQESGALHPHSILRSLSARPGAGEHPTLEALDRLERTRVRLRAGAHTLYALPQTSVDTDGVHDHEGAEDDFSEDEFGEPRFAEVAASERTTTHSRNSVTAPRARETGELYGDANGREPRASNSKPTQAGLEET